MLNDKRIVYGEGPKKGPVVVFLHGYGSSGALMADYMGGYLKDKFNHAVMRFPDGPQEIHRDQNGNYRSWFEVRDIIDQRPPPADLIAARTISAVPEIHDYLKRVMAEEGVDASRIILAGFSQGATMAFFSALTFDQVIGGLYSLSGGAADRLDNPKAKPPVLLASGEQEHSYCGTENTLKAHFRLAGQGFDVGHMIFSQQEHELSPRAMDALVTFARQKTPKHAL